MKIKDFLQPENVALNFVVADKASLLDALATKAGAALGLPYDVIATALKERDALGSTGIGDGVCIPHARFREVQRPFGMLFRLKRPLSFDAIDGQPVDLAFLLILPSTMQIDQVNALAAVARRLRVSGTLEQLRTADNERDFYAAVAG
jgi:PTS system nitrogen regulatory IIA component